jgi:TonB dependent receptor-like, beta-barrel
VTGQQIEKPSYGSARFGVNVGGALRIPHIIHDERTFFFLNYQGLTSRTSSSSFATVPTELERSGDFSQSVVRGPVTVFDPVTRAPFPGNVVPQSQIDAAARGLLPYIPLPNLPGQVQNYQLVRSVPQNTENLGFRLMRPVGSKDNLSYNMNFQHRDSKAVQLYGFTDDVSGTGWSSGLGWTHTFHRGLLNNLRWNFSRNRNETLPAFAYGTNVAAQLGIQGTSQDPINYGPPNLSFTNFGALSDANPSLRRDQTSGLNDGFTWVRGRHTMSFGGEYRRVQNNLLSDEDGRGSLTFSGLLTSQINANGQPVDNTGYDLADFLLGFPQSSSIRFGTASNYFRSSVYSTYAQDDWRIRPNLTLLFGLRYEYFTPASEKYGHMANLDIKPGFTGVAVVTPDLAGPYTGNFPAGLIDPDKNNLSPRLGIAWRPIPAKQLLVRAGYSIFHNGSIYSQFPSRLASQPPFAVTGNLLTTTNDPLTIVDGFPTAPTGTITNTYAADRAYRVAYAQTWNLSIQQSLPHSLIVELGYLGTKGTRLDIQSYPNRAAPGSPLSAEDRLRIGNATGFTYDTSNGDSIYHAAQVRFTRRFSRGIAGNVLYTFAKSIDNASSIGGGGATVAQNDLDLRAERGLSSFDQRHTLSVNYVLTSPVRDNGFLAGHDLAAKFLKDWTLTGGVTASSGTPLTARVLGNQSDTAGTGSVGSGRASATGLPVQNGSGYFNLAAFTVPEAGTFGNAGRNTIPGPNRFSLNASFGRSFRLDDRRQVEFRVESQNVTNHVSISGFNTVVNAKNEAVATSAAAMRKLTLNLRLRF